MTSRDVKVMRGDGSNEKETSKGTKEKQGAKNQLWRKCGEGGGTSEPNQIPFFAVKLNKK